MEIEKSFISKTESSRPKSSRGSFLMFWRSSPKIFATRPSHATINPSLNTANSSINDYCNRNLPQRTEGTNLSLQGRSKNHQEKLTSGKNNLPNSTDPLSSSSEAVNIESRLNAVAQGNSNSNGAARGSQNNTELRRSVLRTSIIRTGIVGSRLKAKLDASVQATLQRFDRMMGCCRSSYDPHDDDQNDDPDGRRRSGSRPVSRSSSARRSIITSLSHRRIDEDRSGYPSGYPAIVRNESGSSASYPAITNGVSQQIVFSDRNRRRSNGSPSSLSLVHDDLEDIDLMDSVTTPVTTNRTPRITPRITTSHSSTGKALSSAGKSSAVKSCSSSTTKQHGSNGKQSLHSSGGKKHAGCHALTNSLSNDYSPGTLRQDEQWNLREDEVRLSRIGSGKQPVVSQKDSIQSTVNRALMLGQKHKFTEAFDLLEDLSLCREVDTAREVLTLCQSAAKVKPKPG